MFLISASMAELVSKLRMDADTHAAWLVLWSDFAAQPQ